MVKLIRNYRAGLLGKEDFINAFSRWQTAQGMDFSSRFISGACGSFVMYRGQSGRIENGLIFWHGKAFESVFAFKRNVDFLLCNGGDK